MFYIWFLNDGSKITMSGFVGYMLNTEKEINQDEMNRLTNMTNIIAHRGPDEENFYTDENVRLGFRRLDTKGLDNGQQSLSYEDNRYHIVFDGQIYNYIELRKQLEKKGYTFETRSDTEILITLYIDKKELLLHDLRGMFSFLIWDKQEKELFGARDPFGSKPFYMMEDDQDLYFASEMKSLQSLVQENFGKETEINLEGLQHYFSFQYVPEPQTMKKGISKLEPGHYFVKKLGEKIEVKSYWKPFFKPKKYSFNSQAKKIQDTLRESVALHMRSDVPVGAFLSGGVDSSVIVALAKEINPSIETFTVGFKRDGFSEIEIAKETAEQLEVKNNHYVITPEEFIKELPNVIYYMDDPVADPAAVPLYFAAREARKKVNIILSGEGADELFAGYNIYREPGSLKVFDYIPKPLQSALKSLARQFPEGMRGKSFLERGTTSLENRFIGNANLFSETEKELFVKTYQQDYNFKKVTHPLYDQVRHYSDVQKMQYIDLHTWARGDIIVKADRIPMAHSLQLRSPFLDREVFKVASELHPEHTIANKTTKYILREAIRGVVPDSVLYNRKLGFPVPIRHWLKNELYDWAKTVIKDSPTDQFIDKSYILNLLELHQQEKIDYSRKIWSVLVFMIWYKIVFENEHYSSDSFFITK